MRTHVNASLLGFVLATAIAGSVKASAWEQIDASAPFVDSDGISRTPGCSAGPVVTATGLQPADPDFSFFVRHGDPSKWVFALDGGGACWDPNTCIGSALAGNPIYNLEVDETPTELAALGGLGDDTNPANPVSGYTVVFIPYCTGDVHMGAADTTYFFEAPDGSQLPWTIHHRGYDNVIAVLEWATHYFEDELGSAPQVVLWTGASAGGYGVQFAYPALHERLPPSTRIRVLTDSASGIINEDFHERALSPGGAWNVWQNVAPELANALASPLELPIAMNQSLGSSYPHTRFGQYTRAWDNVQIFYLNVAKHVDSPERWLNPVDLLFTGLEWSFRARAAMALSALTTSNYRMYLASGDQHTIIADASFYTESSADGVIFSRWVDDMINRRAARGGNWRNVTCTPNCLP